MILLKPRSISFLFIFSILVNLAGAKADTGNEADLKKTAEAEPTTARWFSNLSIGWRNGASLMEQGVGRAYHQPTYAFGGDLQLNIVDFGLHRIQLMGGFLYPTGEWRNGTTQINVTVKQNWRFDWSLGYEFRWKLLIAGGRVGAALARMTTHAAQYEVEVENVGDQLIFTKLDVIDEKNAAGNNVGFLGGLSVGLNLAHWFPQRHLLDFRLHTDYFRRDNRNDLAIWAVVSFWPFDLFR